VLDELATALKTPALASDRFRIEGHTDTVGSDVLNQALSQRRAVAVADYLAERWQIDRARLRPEGLGKAGQLVPTPDQTPEQRNRRVLVVNIAG
jgi:outer membrane protein OmpA-like peptidoglycan-associated protein